MEENQTKQTPASTKKHKFNIIDLIFIVIVIAGLVFVGYKVIGHRAEAKLSEKYVITYYSLEIPEFLTQRIESGDLILDDADNTPLGTVIDKKVEDSIVYTTNDDGQIVVSTKPNYKSIKIYGEVDASEFSNGIMVEGNKYGIGHTSTMRVGDTKLYMQISDIQKKSETEYAQQ